VLRGTPAPSTEVSLSVTTSFIDFRLDQGQQLFPDSRGLRVLEIDNGQEARLANGSGTELRIQDDDLGVGVAAWFVRDSGAPGSLSLRPLILGDSTRVTISDPEADPPRVDIESVTTPIEVTLAGTLDIQVEPGFHEVGEFPQQLIRFLPKDQTTGIALATDADSLIVVRDAKIKSMSLSRVDRVRTSGADLTRDRSAVLSGRLAFPDLGRELLLEPGDAVMMDILASERVSIVIADKRVHTVFHGMVHSLSVDRAGSQDVGMPDRLTVLRARHTPLLLIALAIYLAIVVGLLVRPWRQSWHVALRA
jgi:hypothetical protein